jgi:cation:H+ antiporter
MPSSVVSVVLYIASFFGVWFGAGLVVPTVLRLARVVKLPPFVLSFFLLGILTSLPEITIGGVSVLRHDPAIFAGNLIGGVVVMFLAVIPLLGLFGQKLSMPKTLNVYQRFVILIVSLAPSLLAADQQVTIFEAILMILLYGVLFALFAMTERHHSLLKSLKVAFKKSSGHAEIIGLLRVIGGVVLLVVASRNIVSQTLEFASAWQLAPYIVSLLLVSLGTNIPELAIVFRSLRQKHQEVALADYMGSASANTLIFGVLTLMHGQTLILPTTFSVEMVFMTASVVLFFVFSRSGEALSKKECLLMFALYVLFLVVQLR